MLKMATSQIRWKRKDYMLLGKAVARFNRKLDSLSGRNLPKIKSYEEIKGQITTRKELNRVINLLNRFMREGSEELVLLPSGEKVTKWEKQEISNELRIAKANIRRQMKQYEEIVPFSRWIYKGTNGK